jgi:hypothetical protein
MQELEPLRIAMSREKLSAMMAGCLVCLGAGLRMMRMTDADTRIGDLPPLFPAPLAHGFGVLVLLFGVAIGVFCLRRFFDRRPGIVLSAAGLEDRSSATAVGLVPWREITAIREFRLAGQRMLVIEVVDVARYLRRASLPMRLLHRANAALCGSPVVISSNGLAIGFDELHERLRAFRAQFGGRARP